MSFTYYIEQNSTGLVTLKVCEAGEPFEVEPILFGFGIGEPDEMAHELATVIICDYLDIEIKPFNLMIGDHEARKLSGPFMWAFLLEPGPVIVITKDQIKNYLEVVK